MFYEEMWVDRCQSCKHRKYQQVANSRCRGCKYFYRSQFEPKENGFETVISAVCPYCRGDAEQHSTKDGFVWTECKNCYTVHEDIRPF